MTSLKPPVVVVDVLVDCPDCHTENRVVTDGRVAYTEADGREFVGGSRDRAVVSVLCPTERDGEVCRGTILLDLSAGAEQWVWANDVRVDALGHGAPLDIDT